MIEAIIFDMDGLMLDTENVALECWQKAGEQYGYTITKELMLQAIGTTITDTKQLLFNNFGDDFPFEEARNLRSQYIKEHIDTHGIPTKEGLIDLLAYCQKEQIPIAVATSTHRHRAEPLLEKIGIKAYFDYIICGDDVTKGKPEPDIFLLASKTLGIHTNRCIVLEDSENGVLAASRAGTIPIWVPDLIIDSTIAKHHAKYICDSLIDAKILIEHLRE